MSRLSTMVNKTSGRRGPREMQAIRDAILEVLREENPATCRSVFYRLVSRGAVAKTEAEYKGTVIRLLSEMRLDGSLPWGWIADGTRHRHKPRTFSGLESMLEHTRDTYRRDLWEQQPAYVEVWCEKDGLVGVLEDVTWGFDVPLLPCKGYPSLTYLHEAAEQLADVGKPAFLYYFGDHDPSGVDIDRKVEQRLRQFAPDADITFTRVAVLESQIEELKLPTRPTKTTDSRSKNFTGESVEVDAIPPSQLRAMAEKCINRHIDARAWDALLRVEDLEKETIAGIQRNLRSQQGPAR
jgi:hypothetical protein